MTSWSDQVRSAWTVSKPNTPMVRSPDRMGIESAERTPRATRSSRSARASAGSSSGDSIWISSLRARRCIDHWKRPEASGSAGMSDGTWGALQS